MMIEFRLFGVTGLHRIIIILRDGCCLQCCGCSECLNDCLMECLLVCTRSKVGICTSCSSWLFLLLFGITFVVINMSCLLVTDAVSLIALSAILVIYVIMVIHVVWLLEHPSGWEGVPSRLCLLMLVLWVALGITLQKVLQCPL